LPIIYLPWKGLGDASGTTAGGRHGASRVHRFALHFPSRGNKPLGGTVEVVRCSAYAISASAGNRAGRTSL
jgi:hypothetical protein